MKHRKHWPTRQSPTIPRLPKPSRPKVPLSSYLPRFSDLYSSSVYAAPVSLHNEKNQPCSCSCFSSVTNPDRIALQPNPHRLSPKVLQFVNRQIFGQRQDPDAAASTANQESKQVKNRVRISAKTRRNLPRQWGASAFLNWKSAHQDDEVLLRDGSQRSRSTCVHPRPPDQRQRLAQLSLAIMNPMKFPRSSPEPLHSSTPFFSWMILGLFRSSTPLSQTNLVHSSTYFSWMILVYLHSSTFFSWMCTWASSFIDLLLMDDTFVLLHTSTVFSWMCTWASSFIHLPLMDDSFVLLHLSTVFSWIGTLCFFIHPPSSHG